MEGDGRIITMSQIDFKLVTVQNQNYSSIKLII
jgi:hypothetical protein